MTVARSSGCRGRVEQRLVAEDVPGGHAVGVLEDDDVLERGQLGAHLEEALEEAEVLGDGHRGVAVGGEVLHLLRRR
jgi:hypothetical protein